MRRNIFRYTIELNIVYVKSIKVEFNASVDCCKSVRSNKVKYLWISFMDTSYLNSNNVMKFRYTIVLTRFYASTYFTFNENIFNTGTTKMVKMANS